MPGRRKLRQQKEFMKRSASALWQGGLKDGKGMLSTDSGVLAKTPYSFSTRFEGQPGTNPEELIAAAHAGCFSMALSGELGKAGMVPETIRTAANLTMDKLEGGWTVTQIHLDVTVKTDAIAGLYNGTKSGWLAYVVEQDAPG